MTNSKRTLRFASISDIHLGHHKTPTVDIIANLRKAFPDNEETGKLDLIWFGGDVFDRALMLHDPNVVEIEIWLHQFLRMCKKRDIIVRVLEGTPSHDWRQSRCFTEVNENALIGADVQYIDTLSVQYIERLCISVLYVPDEWAPETDDVWKQVLQTLKSHSLEKVDFAVIHGSFTHQLPPHVKVPMHITERYLGIVKQYILVGHIHKPSQYERILANGSFDRLSHGEEEPKGHWLIEYSPTEGSSAAFIENKRAKIYKSIDCSGLDIDQALTKVKVVEALPSGSHVRICAKKEDPIFSNIDFLRQKYPRIHWSSNVTDNKNTQSNLLVDLRDTSYQLKITKENIVELVLSRLRNLSSDDRLIAHCSKRLMELTQ